MIFHAEQTINMNWKIKKKQKKKQIANKQYLLDTSPQGPNRNGRMDEYQQGIYIFYCQRWNQCISDENKSGINH